MTTEYHQFPLENYLSCNFLTNSVIQNLKNNAKILSIGVGLGTYEEHLISAHNIPRSSIYCADYNLDKKWQGPFGFQFDIRTNWPTLNAQFDYILFGQVIGVSANAGRPVSLDMMATHAMHVIEQAKRFLKKKGKIFIYDTTLPTAILGRDAIDAKSLYNEIANALDGTITRAVHFGSQIEISF